MTHLLCGPDSECVRHVALAYTAFLASVFLFACFCDGMHRRRAKDDLKGGHQ